MMFQLLLHSWQSSAVSPRTPIPHLELLAAENLKQKTSLGQISCFVHCPFGFVHDLLTNTEGSEFNA